MRSAHRLAILILVDALLTLAVVHRAQQHEQALKLRVLAVRAIELSRSRHKAMR